MTYQRMTRRHRYLKYMRAKKERVHTGLGHLFNLMRYFRLTWLAKVLVRSKWHVADLYVDGRFVKALYIFPKEQAKERIARINKEVAELVNARTALEKARMKDGNMLKPKR